MKTKRILLLIAITLCLYACQKDLNQPAQAALVAKWNIVTDSTYQGVGYSNHPVDYAGQPGDYFDIRANGIIYTKEGAVLDTLSYTLVSDTSVIITSFGANLNGVQSTSHISNLTAHTVKISSPVILTPGGVFARKVSLSR